MQTQIFSSIREAALLLKKGMPIAFPTETVYGLGAPIFNERAIAEIFRIKGRPSDNPLIAHIASLSDVEKIASLSSNDFIVLAEAFFPGPLTLVLPKNERVPAIATAGQSTIAFRMPDHPIALELIRTVGEPLVAPSANLSGKPSPTTAAHVLEDLAGKIAGVIDGGPTRLGLESTVISLVSNEPVLLRPGMISKEEIEEILGKSVRLATEGDAIHSPGMKYRHYAPKGKVLLFESKTQLEKYLDRAPQKKRMQFIPEPVSLYAMLRQADAEYCEEILILCDEDVHSNLALMNRLLKAGSYLN